MCHSRKRRAVRHFFYFPHACAFTVLGNKKDVYAANQSRCHLVNPTNWIWVKCGVKCWLTCTMGKWFDKNAKIDGARGWNSVGAEAGTQLGWLLTNPCWRIRFSQLLFVLNQFPRGLYLTSRKRALRREVGLIKSQWSTQFLREELDGTWISVGPERDIWHMRWECQA